MSLNQIIEEWQGRPTFAVIDLDAFATNVRTMRAWIEPNARYCAVVKANAYGLGAIPLSKVALENGADMVAVATVDEGAQLRRAGIRHDILLMGPMGRGEKDLAVGMDMTVVMNDLPFAGGLARAVRENGRTKPLKVHLKVDTGMRRMGVMPQDAVAAAQKIMSYPELKLEGLMTHFASADMEDMTSAERQVAVFDSVVADLDAAGIDIPVKHMCNSAGTVQRKEWHRDMVRSGIATYGVRPAPHIPLPGELGEMKQIMSLHSQVMRVIPLAIGDAVSYGGTWVAQQETRGALVPIGYADGYLRTLSNRGYMGVEGERAPIIGRVCMDQTILEMPVALPSQTRQRVTIIGNGTDEQPGAPSLEELAEIGDTIPHELITSIAPRVPKLYVRDGQVVAVSDLDGYREFQRS
ncbi:MAG: alanine racemase [Thermomicrobiales bacterium]|nr:alanine racemase [Thermomicrobiales bacterium]